MNRKLSRSQMAKTGLIKNLQAIKVHWIPYLLIGHLNLMVKTMTRKLIIVIVVVIIMIITIMNINIIVTTIIMMMMMMIKILELIVKHFLIIIIKNLD